MPRASASSGRTAVVVGAGFAGLAAADALAAGGADVVVLEASDRVGGRVRSHALADGSVVELGAEFALPGYTAMHETAARLGLRLYEKGTLYGDRDPVGGVPTTSAEVLAAAERLTVGGDGSVVDALARLVPALGPREAIASRIAVSTAFEPSEQPASVVADGAARFGDHPSYGVAGGNDRLALELARDRVRRGERVTEIAWNDDGVRVGDLEADVCVLAVPAPATLAIAFDPPLPAWKRDALAAVRYGDAAKLFLPLEEPAPPSQTLCVPDRFWVWTQHAPGGGSLPVASAFAGTTAALDRLRVQHGPQTWSAAVRRLRPDLQYAHAEPVIATWPDGVYSVEPLDEEALAAPVGPLAFAGEHTAGAWHALMEGALRSGGRAAADVATFWL